MKYRDNDVYFSLSDEYTLINGSYTVESFRITEHQDPDGNIYNGLVVPCGEDGELTFRIGRSGSEDVADWFNDRVPPSQTTFNHDAGKLNFAFLGTLVLTIKGGILGDAQETYKFQNVALAQGHAGSSNNWWFGGQNCAYIENNQVICQGENSKGDPASFVFLRGGNNVSTVKVTPTTLIDTKDWMGKLEDSVRLDNLMMPGSHDAGMSELHHCAPPVISEPYTKTQADPIGQQLVNGARYFDIRVDYDYDTLVTYHRDSVLGVDGLGCNGQDFESVLNQSREFLTAHPSETIFLKISHIRNDSGHDKNDTKQRIDSFLDSYQDYMYSNPTTDINLAELSLGDVRGKMILVFDYDSYINTETGRFRYKDGESAKPNLTVYDKYSNTANYEKMSSDQIKKWEEHGGLGQGFLFLLSWTLTSLPHSAEPISVLAAQANNELPKVLYEQIIINKADRPNIVYIDYVNNTTTQCIIRYNFISDM